MLSFGIELGPDRADGSVPIRRVAENGSWKAAGGCDGDVCWTIYGEPATRVFAEWAAGSRPRVPDVPGPVELERDGRRLTIYPCWREIPDSDPAAEADASPVEPTFADLYLKPYPQPAPSSSETPPRVTAVTPFQVAEPLSYEKVYRDTLALRGRREAGSAIDDSYDPFAS